MYTLSTFELTQHTCPVRRLLAYAFDPDLDKKMPCEFIVYAIPLGLLGQQLDEFFELTLNQELRNGAHKSFPHSSCHPLPVL